MKKLLFVFFASIAFLSGHGQDSTQKQPGTYIFDHFVEGKVLQKTGATESALLNYDAENQSIIFQQNGQNMILTGLENVDTVYIGEKKFVAAEDRFYAICTSTKKQIIRVFPRQESRINEFLSNNKIDFQQEKDVARLIAFCSH